MVEDVTIGGVRLIEGDCLEVLRTLPDASVHAVVTDPPAGISFMNKEWDHHKGGRREWCAWMEQIAAECLRVIRPGGHALVWALPRTSHWTATAWEDAGWQVRDRLAHLFGSGFPKSLDVSKAIDRMAGAEREVVGLQSKHYDGHHRRGGSEARLHGGGVRDIGDNVHLTAPATDAARQWAGYGTALKPAVEDWWLFRRPLAESSVAANVLKHGTGALNVAASRVGTGVVETRGPPGGGDKFRRKFTGGEHLKSVTLGTHAGRWPPNLLHDGSPEVLAAFQAFGERSSGVLATKSKARGWTGTAGKQSWNGACGDTGSAARYFPSLGFAPDELRFHYSGKAAAEERNYGLDGLETKPTQVTGWSGDGMPLRQDGSERKTPVARNVHPCIKPIALMQWLCRLVTPPGGVVLDCFAGSGSTGVAASRLGMRAVLIEREREYFDIAAERLRNDAPLLTAAPEPPEAAAEPGPWQASLFDEEAA